MLAGRERLGLPADRVPQLREVDAVLRPLTGFGYRAVAGLVATATDESIERLIATG